MWTSPPVTVTGTAFTVANPSKPQNSQPAVAVQVANASPWIVTCQAGGQQITIQPFVAATIAVALGNDLGITPSLLAYTQLPPGYVQAVWLQAKELPPQPDGPLTAAATIAASLGVADTQLVPSPFFFPASTLAPGKLFTIPAGSPSFSNLLIGFETAGAGTAGLANIVVDGDTSGIHYLLATTLQRGEFITCPFSSVADPTGVRLGVTFPAGGTGTFAVIGQVNPTTVRALIGAKQLSGPTDYKHAITSGVTLIPAGASAQSIVRVWSAWVSIAHTAAADGSVQLGAGGTVVFVNAQSPAGGGSDANSISHPGGVPIAAGANAVILSAGAGSVRGGIAWSIDVV